MKNPTITENAEIYGHINICFKVDLPNVKDDETTRMIARLAIYKATGMPKDLLKAFVVDRIEYLDGRKDETHQKETA